MKKKFLYSFLALVFCLPVMFLASACAGVSVNKVELDTTSAKTEFVVGEEFTSTGLVVNATYSDGKETVVNDFEVDSSRFNKNIVGSYVIYVTYEDITESYAVSVVEDYIVDFAVETKHEKFFIGQDFKTNAVVTAAYKSGKVETIENYVMSGFDSSAEVSGQEVTVAYGDKTAKIGVDVLSNQNYMTFVKNKLDKHILSSSNCSAPFNETQPTAEVDFEIDTVAIYGQSNELTVANNGKTWYFSSSGVTNWYDLNTNTMYTKISADSSATKRTFNRALDACAWLSSSLQLGVTVSNYLRLLFDNDVSYVFIVNASINADVVSFSLADNVLTIGFSSGDEFYMSVNYEDFTLIEFIPARDSKYKFNQQVTIPEIPQDVEWTEVQ